jgi:uncharacterized protein (TIGR00106 family)
MTIHAEISIIPLPAKGDTSMSGEVAAAFDAIRKVRGVKATLTALGTQLEAESIEDVLRAIKEAHYAATRAGAERIISNTRIDERLDKEQTLNDKVRSVQKKLRKSKRR